MIALPAVPAPHEGTSYNPLVTSHQELLRTAHEIEEQRLKEAEKLEQMKAKIEEGRKAASDTRAEGIALGMMVDEAQEPANEDAQDDDAVVQPAKKMPERKTKQERRKVERLRAEVRVVAPS